MPTGLVLSVSRDLMHRFSKVPCDSITLAASLGVVGDAHAGTLVQHRSRVRRDPNQQNLRQVHLIHAELFAEAAERGHQIGPGDLGENITTHGVPLLDLPVGTLLHLGEVVVRLTGLRNPCRQIDDFQKGLLKVVVARADGVPSTAEPTLTATGGVDRLDGSRVVRKAGVMGVVTCGGEVRPGQAIVVVLPDGPHTALEPV
ncbi:molybdenum cofactor biosysynthesis protein [Humibacillus sp. DSM 29435]|uniref:MOSC domain-containing protein n=1 Tax=Humibacillus sp. DSM 29435 TaxID=1869167 RepID=UPI000872EA84|nr:MOSC domain-containing protein [Humibacillus sp. DSM 29435]OFE18340.1 molybdenum cofactor biosysynthesis protein [Humibacillus sp. DSM 29435]